MRRQDFVFGVLGLLEEHGFRSTRVY